MNKVFNTPAIKKAKKQYETATKQLYKADAKRDTKGDRATEEAYAVAEAAYHQALAQYAQVVFALLSPLAPKLYSYPDKKVIAWSAAFPDRFEKVDPILYVSLVALAEEVGGRYELRA